MKKILFFGSLVLLCLTSQSQAAVDAFGVREIYPSKGGGNSWDSSTWNNGHSRTLTFSDDSPYDPNFDVAHGNGSYAIDGSGMLVATGDTLRMYTHSPTNAFQWRDIEATMYMKWVSGTMPAYSGLEMVARTNHQVDANLCDTRGVDARMRRDGHIDFEKETSHPDSVAIDNGNFFGGTLPSGVWIGYKLVVYDTPAGKTHIEMWYDDSVGSGGGNWVKIESLDDDGTNFGIGGTACHAGANPTLRLSSATSRSNSETGKPNASVYWRADSASGNIVADYKWVSVREIDATTSAPIITPSAPVVKQGSTLQFSETLGEVGTWSCSGTNSTGGVTACSGSINSGTGLYTAPSSVTAQHVYGGLQVGPNNDVFNTRIDSMPVDANSALYINTVNQGGTPHWNTDFPINYVLPTGSSDSMHFFYSEANNGTFEVPSFPNAKAEHGWFGSFQLLNDDHHVIMVDTVTAGGTFSEFYQYYPNCITTAASITSNVATLTCSKNPQTNAFLAGSTVSVGGFTGSDTYFNGGPYILSAVTATSISFPLTHANATASTNGAAGKNWSNDSTGLVNSQGGITYSSMSYVLPPIATDAAGMRLQPLILGLQELEHAVTTGGEINHAFRNTFGQAYEASSSTWPATTFASDGGTVPFGARMRLKASVNISTYSATAQVLLRALKHYGTFNVDGGNNGPMNAEQTRWPKAYIDAIAEIANATNMANMEFVNESGLMISSLSSLTTNNREIVRFTRTADSSSTVVDVALNGPAVNFAQDILYIMAGTPAQQLPVLNNYGGYTCSMNPSTGTLTSGCLYTPPAVLLVATTTIITATSVINSSASAIMTLTVLPSTGIYIIPSQTSDYIDTHGNTYLSRAGIVNSPDTQGCCACDNAASFSGTDVSLWNCQVGNSSNAASDTHMDILVPNGTYRVVHRYGTQTAVGAQFIKYSIGSSEISSNLDPSASAGGQFKLFTSTNTTTVTNNQLQVGIWTMNDQGAPVSSLSITSTTVPVVFPSETFTGTIRIQGSAAVFK